MDLNGDRISNYAVWHLPKDGEQYEVLLEVMMETEDDTIIAMSYRNWGATGTTPPDDVPKCGFQDELCPEDSSRKCRHEHTQITQTRWPELGPTCSCRLVPVCDSLIITAEICIDLPFFPYVYGSVCFLAWSSRTEEH